MPLFVSCTRGAESYVAEELVELDFSEPRPGYCGVYVDDESMAAIYKINYCSRLASRVLLPLKRFRCRDEADLYRHGRGFDWSPYFRDGSSLAIDANVQHQNIRHSLFAAQRLKDAICDSVRERCGLRPSVDLNDPDVQLNLYIDGEEAIISLDTSNQPLYKRGYRSDRGSAPMQESLAALLLRIAGYDPIERLLDPCCGSGTFLIEAALMATHTPPGYLRQKSGLKHHPAFDHSEWRSVKEEADQKRRPLKAGLIEGLDIDREMIHIAKANIKAAGFSNLINLVCTDFQNFSPKSVPSFLITNPPHGKRLGHEEELVSLYHSLGDFLKQKLNKPARAFIFTSNKVLAKSVGLKASRRHIINAGGLEARLLEFLVY